MPKTKLAKARQGLGQGFYWVQIMEGQWEPAHHVDGTFFIPACAIGFDKVLVCGAQIHPPGPRTFVTDASQTVALPRAGEFVASNGARAKDPRARPPVKRNRPTTDSTKGN